MRAAMAAEARSFCRRRVYVANTREVRMGMKACRALETFAVRKFSAALIFGSGSFGVVCLLGLVLVVKVGVGDVVSLVFMVAVADVLVKDGVFGSEDSGGGMKFFVVFSISISSFLFLIFKN